MYWRCYQRPFHRHKKGWTFGNGERVTARPYARNHLRLHLGAIGQNKREWQLPDRLERLWGCRQLLGETGCHQWRWWMLLLLLSHLTTSSLTIPVSDPVKISILCVLGLGTSFESWTFQFSTTSVTTIDNNAITAVYSYGDRIVAHNVKAGGP